MNLHINKKLFADTIRAASQHLEIEITGNLVEITWDGVTSKGSRFRKSVFEYESIDSKNKSNRLIVEVNSFANPFPYQSMAIKSMINNFLVQTNNTKYIDQYDLQAFSINVLSKEQTMLEKLVSLIRFSYDENPNDSISQKIRHFYDLFFLAKDTKCARFLKSATFKQRFNEILDHDRDLFDKPHVWKYRTISESPLINNFPAIWGKLKSTYKTELSALAYTPIPDQQLISKSFAKILEQLK